MRPRSRRSELDGLRGLAVLLMLGQHLMVWLWDHNPASPLALPLTAISAAGGLAAPLFVTLAGCGSALGYRPDDPRPLRCVLRGLALMAMAYALSLATPSWFSLRSFYVLHLLAIGLMIGPWCARQSLSRLAWLALLTVLFTASLQSHFELPLSIGNRFMSARPLTPGLGQALQDNGLRALIAGHFPLFPWLTPFLLGVMAGKVLRSEEALSFRFSGLVLGVGVLGLLPASLGLIPAEANSWLYRLTSPKVPFFPCSAALCVALCGVSLLLVSIAQRTPKLVEPLVCTGRISLTVLMIHLPLFRELSRPLQAWRNLDGITTLVTIGITGSLCVLIAGQWQRINYRYGAEWLLRQVDRLAPMRSAP